MIAKFQIFCNFASKSHLIKFFMKRQLLLSLCLGSLFAASVMADDVTTATMKIEGDGVTLGNLPLSTLSEITFSDNNMVITDGTESQSFSLADISEITFAIVTSSSESISADLADNLRVNLQNCILTVTADADASIDMVIYALNGRMVASQSATGTLTADLNDLTKGVYIIKVNDKAIKFIR